MIHDATRTPQEWHSLLEDFVSDPDIFEPAPVLFRSDAHVFRKGRDIAAWLGLTPRQHSAGGKQKLGATTKMGERSLRRSLIIGANSVIIKRHCHASARPGTWLAGMLERKPAMLLGVALANKMARIVWALMKSGEVYRAPAMAA